MRVSQDSKIHIMQHAGIFTIMSLSSIDRDWYRASRHLSIWKDRIAVWEHLEKSIKSDPTFPTLSLGDQIDILCDIAVHALTSVLGPVYAPCRFFGDERRAVLPPLNIFRILEGISMEDYLKFWCIVQGDTDKKDAIHWIKCLQAY